MINNNNKMKMNKGEIILTNKIKIKVMNIMIRWRKEIYRFIDKNNIQLIKLKITHINNKIQNHNYNQI
jgi:hypothetical protein